MYFDESIDKWVKGHPPENCWQKNPSHSYEIIYYDISRFQAWISILPNGNQRMIRILRALAATLPREHRATPGKLGLGGLMSAG